MSQKPLFAPDIQLAVSAEILAELKKIYNDLEAQLRNIGAECEICGKCCHFHSYDHELRLTQLELAYLITHHGLRRPTRDGVCPYLEENRCTARDGRALGCRVFVCGADREVVEDLYERSFAEIRALAKRKRLPIVYEELLAALEKGSERNAE